jgi:hypothetical protein
MVVTGGSKKAIDVLLVNPGSQAAVYQDLGDRYSAIEPPSLAGLFATYLRKRGLAVDLVTAASIRNPFLIPRDSMTAVMTKRARQR